MPVSYTHLRISSSVTKVPCTRTGLEAPTGRNSGGAEKLLGVRDLKISTFGPRPQDFFACNAPSKGLDELGVEVEENSELDLLVSYKEHANDPRIEDVCKDMAAEMGEGHYYPCLLYTSRCV